MTLGLPRALCATLLCLACTAPLAQELRLPPSVASELGSVSLVGRGQMRWLGLSIYDARLWAPRRVSPQDWARQPFALELEYRRSFRGSDIARVSVDEMKRAGDVSPEQAERWQQDMQRLIPDVSPGDRVAGIYAPGRGVRFVVNGRSVGEIDDAEFARRFFGIWLAPGTSEPDLRASLLGQG